MKFFAEIQSFGINDTFIGPYFIIPDAIALELLKNTIQKRILCTINNKITIPRIINFSKKENFYYVLISKSDLKNLNINFNSEVAVALIPDKSKYGMPICEEFQEVLFQDPEGEILFDALLPGKKRSLIFYISKIKSSQLKIERCFVILNHLKNNKGNLNTIQLQIDIRNSKNNLTF